MNLIKQIIICGAFLFAASTSVQAQKTPIFCGDGICTSSVENFVSCPTEVLSE